MTYDEAIDFILKEHEFPKSMKKEHVIAIKALEIMAEMEKRNFTPDIIMEYAKFEDECVKKGYTFKSLLEARDKMTPRKPIEYEDKMWCCPNCTNNLLPKWEKYTTKLYNRKAGLPYCLSCGQAIDWSE